MRRIFGYDIGGRTKVLTFQGDDDGRFWIEGGMPTPIPTVETPHGGNASDFMARLTDTLRAEGLWGSDNDLVAYSICGPVVGKTCLNLINRDIHEPFVVGGDSVGNDGMMAAVGSLVGGAARGHQGGLVTLTLGTGIGMGSFHWDMNGKRVMNDGEAHFTIRDSMRVCNCRRRGCFEAAANERALATYAREAGWNYAETDEDIDLGRTLEQILQTEGHGDRDTIVAAVDRWHWVLAQGLANLFSTLNLGGDDERPPALFVLAGGLSALVNPDVLRQCILEEFEGAPFLGTNIEVRRETLGNAAGCVGAAACALADDLGYQVTDIQFLEKPPQ